MSSEWKDPGKPEEHPTNPIWYDLEEAPLPQGQQSLLSVEEPALLEDEGDPDDLDETSSSRLESLLLLGRQVSPALVPLLFGILTFLCIILPVIKGRAYLSQVGPLPIVLILAAITVVHAMMLYYAGSNNVLWSLALVGGFALFLLTGCFIVFGPILSLILLVIILGAGFLMVRLYIHPVSEGYADIAFSFGKYSRTLFPGPNFLLPWEHVEYRLNTRETHWTCPMQTVHISRDEDVHLAATIVYQLMPEDAHLAVLQVNDWEASLQKLFLATIQSVVSKFSPEDFVSRSQDVYSHVVGVHSTRWDEVNNDLLQRMQDHVATWGVQINGVHIHDVTVTPRIPVSVDTGPMESLPNVSADAPRGATPTPGPAPVQSQPTPAAGVERPLAPPKAAPASPPAPSSVPKVVKEEVLARTYNAVRNGTITDPETIRSIADRFKAIASDPEASKAVSFDAARAAQTLYQRADVLSEQPPPPHAQVFASYNDETAHDWSPRRPTDDNLTAGG